ncbi:MAG: ABC transporter substrate-binding protein [Sporichthyaceae bacterium]|nr:ABC transporter substrate-binding protein [Sporichthyaceae bacterium]
MLSHRYRTITATLAVVIGTALAAGCAAEDEAQPSASPTASAACAKDALQTVTPDKLTIATDEPVFEPWFVDNEPTNKQGFEGAMAYAIATQMGYTDAEVIWVRVPFNAAIQPGPKNFDFDINEFSITDERTQAVDFSSPYYDVSQAVIALEDNAAAQATNLAGLKEVKLGAQVGTTSLQAIEEVIQPSQDPAVYNTNDDAKQALINGQIDALVLDLPTAFFVTAAEIDGSKIVGQLPPTTGAQEQFGLVLDKGSSLTACVSQAVDALRADGSLDRIEQEWLATTAGAPVLQ